MTETIIIRTPPKLVDVFLTDVKVVSSVTIEVDPVVVMFVVRLDLSTPVVNNEEPIKKINNKAMKKGVIFSKRIDVKIKTIIIPKKIRYRVNII